MAKIILARIKSAPPPVARLRLVGTLAQAQPGVVYESRLSIVGGGSILTAAVRTGTRLPIGLSLSIDYGTRELVVSGTALESGAVYTELQVSDEYGQRAVRAVSWLLQAPPLAITGTLADAEQGVAYSSGLTATGGVLPYTWSVTGSLPSGLTLNTSTGVISGTPTATGTFSIIVTVTDALSNTASSPQNLFVEFVCDPYFSSVVSLLHFDGADGSTIFTDQTGKTWTAYGNAKISTAQSKFGGASAYFDGSGDWIQTPDSIDWTTGTGDFTVEVWIKTPGNGAYDQICGQRDSGGTGATPWSITRDNTNNRLLLAYSNGVTFTTTPGSANVFDDEWHHIALVRNGTSYKQYVDGVLDASLTLPAGYSFYDSSDVFSIGRHGAYDGQYFKGYIDEFRFTKGVARYTSNFTPPTRAFADVACVP